MKQRKIKLGKEAKHTNWGRAGLSRGMYTGGFTRWIYGIKGIISYEVLECWGDFKNMTL